jgi:MYXO-CTERM domain-containing protein
VSRALLLFLALATLPAAAQEYQDPFAEAFEGMFQIEEPVWIPQSGEPPGPPDVPLDGGLTALLAAGAAVGYRRFRTKSPKQP